ncbi:MAG: Arc family DNA-binding protein [Bacillales bacterium]|nr:Arc family DNA-binding protein [Bacillales bacterium]
MSSKDPYTKETDSRFTLRIPTDLLNLIRAEAIKNKRSTGKQIEFILEEWIREQNSTR